MKNVKLALVALVTISGLGGAYVSAQKAVKTAALAVYSVTKTATGGHYTATTLKPGCNLSSGTTCSITTSSEVTFPIEVNDPRISSKVFRSL